MRKISKSWWIALSIMLPAAALSTAALRPRTSISQPERAGFADRLRSPAELTSVMAPIDAWFAGIASADANAIRSQMRIGGGGGATIVKRGNDNIVIARHLTWEENLSYVRPGGQRLREWFVKRPIVVIDGDIAMVWGEYAFSVDSQITHCGVDHFDLIREAGRWRVQNVTWSQRACEWSQ